MISRILKERRLYETQIYFKMNQVVCSWEGFGSPKVYRAMALSKRELWKQEY